MNNNEKKELNIPDMHTEIYVGKILKEDYEKIPHNPNKKRNTYYKVYIEVSFKEKDNLNVFTKPNELTNGMTVSISGGIYNTRKSMIAGGQIQEDILEYIRNGKLILNKNLDKKTIIEIIKDFNRYHLNDFHSGTKEQEKILKGMIKNENLKEKLLEFLEEDKAKELFDEKELNELKETILNTKDKKQLVYNYDISQLILNHYNKLIDNGYKYGTNWLYEEIPQKTLERMYNNVLKAITAEEKQELKKETKTKKQLNSKFKMG